ncbi:MAG: RNA 2',3'-cyclic phosphodiesterase [Minisyncoccia bacterium]
MNLRLFIAINFNDDFRKMIGNKVNELKTKFTNYDFIRFLPPENWHLTILFLGYQNEEKLNTIQTIVKKYNLLDKVAINFNSITYGPINQTPRMIWINTNNKTSQLLGQMQQKISNDLLSHQISFQQENRTFNGHITIARFLKSSFFQKSPLPSLNINLNWQINSYDIVLMQSYLSKSGAHYKIIG